MTKEHRESGGSAGGWRRGWVGAALRERITRGDFAREAEGGDDGGGWERREREVRKISRQRELRGMREIGRGICRKVRRSDGGGGAAEEELRARGKSE